MTDIELELVTKRHELAVKRAFHKLTHEALEYQRKKAFKESEQIKSLEREVKDLQDQIDAEASGYPDEVLGGNF